MTTDPRPARRSLPAGGMLAAAAALFVAPGLAAQSLADGFSERHRHFVEVAEPVVALTGVKVVDGTGAPARSDQTVLLRDGRIAAVGPEGEVDIPAGARVLELPGRTVMPGIVGLHDHMYFSSVMGSMKPMLDSYPTLFLGAGVTTIRTTGSVDPYQELNVKRAIEAGERPGPSIFVTGPYLQGPGPGPGAMHPLDSEEDARRMVRYWAEEGVTWFKAYTQISRAELGAAIDEAHEHGVKVTAHLCSVGFQEAVELGIDNLEHGLLVNTEYWPEKRPDECPRGVSDGEMYGDLDLESPEVQKTFRDMIENGVAMTSTLSVMELSLPDRFELDPRVLEAVHPTVEEALQDWHAEASQRTNEGQHRAFENAMAYEKAFADAGGLLAAGSDPCCLSAIAGYADQRNFELLVEAGFTPEEAARVMTANGAEVLGIDDEVGTVAPGMRADLIVLDGDPTAEPAAIRNTELVFRHGVGYDSAKLIEAVEDRIGVS